MQIFCNNCAEQNFSAKTRDWLVDQVGFELAVRSKKFATEISIDFPLHLPNLALGKISRLSGWVRGFTSVSTGRLWLACCLSQDAVGASCVVAQIRAAKRFQL